MRLILILFIAVLIQAQTCSAQSKTPFQQYGVKGSTTIYDSNNRRWIYTDSIDAQRETLPASTFKIINSLIALETGAVGDENEVIKWDGVKRKVFGHEVPVWNHDTDMREAYKNSTVWFYVELAKRVTKKRYKSYLQQCNYGNANLSEKGVDFWNYGNFGISPQNQIEFLIKLYNETLPFSKSTYQTVKSIMIAEQTPTDTIRAKTGWTNKDGIDIGWWVGYMQTQGNVYFFATRITKKTDDQNPNFSAARKEITKRILKNIQHELEQPTNTTN